MKKKPLGFWVSALMAVKKDFIDKFKNEIWTKSRYKADGVHVNFSRKDGKRMTRHQMRWLEVRLTLEGFRAPT